MSRKPLKFLAAGLSVAVLAMAGCGGDGQAADDGPTPIEFQLNWTAGGVNAGFALAVEEGLYEEQGLDVTIIQGNGSANTAQMVASNQAQIAYSDAGTVAQLINKDAPITVLSTMFQSGPNAIQALKSSGIESMADLKGRSIGVPSGASQTALLPPMLTANGLSEADVNLVSMPIDSLVTALLQEEVEAIVGSVDTFGIQLDQQGADYVEFSFAEHGVPTLGASIIANDKWLEDNEEVVTKFTAASLQGWERAFAEPEKAIDAVEKLFPDTKPELASAELEAIPWLFCANDAQFVGKAEPEAWQRTQDLLSEADLLEAGVDPNTYYSNDYLPADGELQPCVDGEPGETS